MAALLRADVDPIAFATVAQRSDAPGLRPRDARDLRARPGAAQSDLASPEPESDADHLRPAGAAIGRARRGDGRHSSIGPGLRQLAAPARRGSLARDSGRDGLLRRRNRREALEAERACARDLAARQQSPGSLY